MSLVACARRNLERNLELDRPNVRALLVDERAAKPKLPRKQKKHNAKTDPKRTDAALAYHESFGKCRHCGGAHWHRDCPKRKRDPAPDKATKTSGSAALAAAAAPSTNAADAAVGDALFSDGIGSVSFACDDNGAALCVRGTPAVKPYTPHEASVLP
eukprot:3928760-Pleurochrysis_carterae.AAC.1